MTTTTLTFFAAKAVLVMFQTENQGTYFLPFVKYEVFHSEKNLFRRNCMKTYIALKLNVKADENFTVFLRFPPIG